VDSTWQLSMSVLGELRLARDGTALELPPSRKARALLAYLAVTARPHRRERLCAMFWDTPDDPRGALRSSLSKLRAVVDGPERRRIVAARDTVRLDSTDIEIDLYAVRRLACEQKHALERAAQRFRGEFAEGLDLADCPEFQSWLVAQREDARRLRARLLSALIECHAAEPEAALPHARTLVQVDPHGAAAHATLLRLLLESERRREAEEQFELSLRMLEESGGSGPRELAHAWRSLVTSAPAEQPALTVPDKPSIAVLPFTNLSEEPEQEYFADGISEDIITGLSKLRWFFVIARNSSFAYRGQPVDATRAARELGVRYVLEGSVRKGGSRMRVTAQLIDTSSGSCIWADRYDGELSDVFTLQDRITERVVAAIEPKLLEAEALRSHGRSPKDFDAWDMVIHANSLFWRLTRADGEAAVALLRRAVGRYPDYAPAHSMLAFALLMSRILGWSAVAPDVSEAARLAARAAELDDRDPWAHLALGYAAHTMRRTEDAKLEYLRALELNPNFAAAHGYLGFALALAGRTDEALGHLGQATRMSPHDPQNAIFNNALAVAHYLAGRFPEAIRFARKVVQQRDGMTAGHRIYIASLAHAGRMREARMALQHLRELQPNISIAWCEEHVPYTPGPMAKFLEGMRMAGLD
jgi:TolB-like protein/Flp pilus assembly protein TadD